MRVKRSGGFSLVEAMVALAVLAILITVALNAIENVSRERLLNSLRTSANQAARKTLMLFHDDLRSAGYQISFPPDETYPPAVAVNTPPFRVTLRCTRRMGTLSQGAAKGDTRLSVANPSKFESLVGGYIIYTYEGITQALHVSGVADQILFDDDPLQTNLPVGLNFAVVDTVEYTWQDGVVSRRVNGSLTHTVEGVSALNIKFVLDDGSAVTHPNAEQSQRIRYADCDIGIRLEKRVTGGQVYAATASTAQRVALLNMN